MGWTVNTQSSVADAEDALTETFDKGYPDADDASRAQFETAVMTVEQVLKDQPEDDWFQYNMSGHAVGSEEDPNRPHISIGITPVEKPYGVN